METALGRKARFELPTPESTEKYVADVKPERIAADGFQIHLTIRLICCKSQW